MSASKTNEGDIAALEADISSLQSSSSSSSGSGAHGSKTYTTPGTYTFTVPDGVSVVMAEAWGGGGGALGVQSCAYGEPTNGGDSIVEGGLFEVIGHGGRRGWGCNQSNLSSGSYRGMWGENGGGGRISYGGNAGGVSWDPNVDIKGGKGAVYLKRGTRKNAVSPGGGAGGYTKHNNHAGGGGGFGRGLVSVYPGDELTITVGAAGKSIGSYKRDAAPGAVHLYW